jgi:hypothetical protein
MPLPPVQPVEGVDSTSFLQLGGSAIGMALVSMLPTVEPVSVLMSITPVVGNFHGGADLQHTAAIRFAFAGRIQIRVRHTHLLVGC